MTDNIRMSDVFGGGVYVSDITAYIEHDNVTEPMPDSYVLEGESQWVLNSECEMKAAAHAINNHDALQDRIAQLESEREVLIPYLDKLLDFMDRDNWEFNGRFTTDDDIKNLKDVISKLKAK